MFHLAYALAEATTVNNQQTGKTDPLTDRIKYREACASKNKFKLWLVASITYYVSQSVFPVYLSHFSSEWTEIWHDDFLDCIDRA